MKIINVKQEALNSFQRHLCLIYLTATSVLDHESAHTANWTGVELQPCVEKDDKL